MQAIAFWQVAFHDTDVISAPNEKILNDNHVTRGKHAQKQRLMFPQLVCGLSGVGMPPSPPAAASALHCNKCVFNYSEANLSPKWMIMITLYEKSIWREEPEERGRDSGVCVCWGLLRGCRCVFECGGWRGWIYRFHVHSFYSEATSQEHGKQN